MIKIEKEFIAGVYIGECDDFPILIVSDDATKSEESAKIIANYIADNWSKYTKSKRVFQESAGAWDIYTIYKLHDHQKHKIVQALKIYRQERN